jgi:hypothetical protein
LYELPTPERLTSGHGSSGSLPTPNTRDHHAQGANHNTKAKSSSLSTVIQKKMPALLPTPAVNDMGAGKTPEAWDSTQRLLPSDSTGGEGATRKQRQQDGATGGPMLRDVGHLLPTTPTAQAAKHGETPDLTANGSGYNLWDLPRLLPTPISRDHKGGNTPGDSLVDATRRLPGEPTSPPSDDGKPSTGQPHGQLTIEDA